MADLTFIQAAIPSIIVGADATGNEQTPINSSAGGALYSNLRNAAGTESATTSNPLFVSDHLANTPSSPTSFSVGVATGTAVAFNASRKGLVLVNVSNNRISIAFGVSAVLNQGITLYPGGTFVMDAYMYNIQSVSAIASAASSTLSIQEFA